MVKKDAGIEVIVKVDRKGEAAFLDIGKRRVVEHVALGCACALAALLAARPLGILRAAARARASTGGNVAGRDIEYGGSDGEDIHHARLSELGVDAFRGGIFGHDEPAARGIRRSLVEVDGCGVVGKISVVDAIAGDALARGPTATLLGYLAQAGGKLIGFGDKHGDARTVAHLNGRLVRIGLFGLSARGGVEVHERGVFVVGFDGERASGGEAQAAANDRVARERPRRVGALAAHRA